MAFVKCDRARTWTGVEGLQECPQIPQAIASDSGYYMFDFTQIIDADTRGATAVTVIEKNSKTTTITDTSLSDDGRKVSFKAASMSAGTFTFVAGLELNTGASTPTISLQGKLRVAA